LNGRVPHRILDHVKDVHINLNRETPPMHTFTETARSGGITTWPRRTEAWLDARGRKAWIAAMVVGFIFFWPVGLALLAYMIWGKQMFSKSCGHRRDHGHMHDRHWGRHAYRSTSGNTAFDAYKAEALRRLEEEQEAFEAFLQRLRNSKDKSQFDTFMDERARANQAADAAAAAAGSADDKPADGARPGEY
jgi:hypothetical protein